MKMIKATKGEKTITTTVKMYNTVYEGQGYQLVLDEEPADSSADKPIAGMSLQELRKLAKERGIKNTSKLSSAELIKLLEPETPDSDNGGKGGGNNGQPETPDGSQAPAE